MEKFFFMLLIVFCVTRTNSVHTDAGKLSRILNGRPATENQFPFMVSLQRLSEIRSATRGHKCGGVLVTLQHALTAAAYCTLDWGNNGQLVPINHDEYRVFAGSVLLSNDTSADRVRRIAYTTEHPEYNMTVNFYVNNIAVIILGTPFLSNTVAPVTVRDIGNSEIIQGTIIGWGRGTRLMHAPMMSLNETMCRLVMGPLLPDLFCGWTIGSGNSGFAGCEGDQGGPLIYEGGIAGLIIDTRGCSTTMSMPHWYVRVSRYSTWLGAVLALPVPELGPAPPTAPPPTSTAPAPGAASTFRSGMTLFALITVAQITANVIH